MSKNTLSERWNHSMVTRLGGAEAFGCGHKVLYTDPIEAVCAAIRADYIAPRPIGSYQCLFCGGFHIGRQTVSMRKRLTRLYKNEQHHPPARFLNHRTVGPPY